MDPADTDPLPQDPVYSQADTESFRHALTAQGAQVGHHEQLLQEVTETLKPLSTHVTRIGSQVDFFTTRLSNTAPELQPSQPPPVIPAAFPTLPAREPHVPVPERYSGDLGTCRAFLMQCSLIRIAAFNLHHR